MNEVKIMKKYLLLLVLGCLILTGCSSPIQNIAIESSVDDFDMNNFNQPETVTIEANQLLYNDNGIKIISDSIESDSTETFLVLNFENTTDQPISITCESAAINNFMILPSFTIDLDSGDSVLTGIPFSNTELNACEITTITDIEFTLSIYDALDFDFLCETDTIHVQTNQASSYKQTINTNGTIIYDKDNIQIISKGFAQDNEWGDVIVLLVTNNSNKDIFFGIQDNTAIANNTEYEVTFGCNIMSGHNAVKYLYFQNNEGNTITNISTASAKFILTDTNSWKTIATTPEIDFSKQ